ncbi:Hint domain-containing protein [Methylobacterium sp. J-090]|uniref:Hint domain-containing protein n=1 Tax=Methylobacterium sp. J-090 TaxID=2836666 RepID=UPI001FB9DB4B|nr:Hint domain-containing protein [Methylobacterium sp. J-090]MCJ2081395.1 Hint domain-containing protein [Methylobacterium sp. J-090]
MVDPTSLSAAQRDELIYLTGLDESGAIAKNTYFTDSVTHVTTTRAWLNKWNNGGNGSPLSPTSLAGTPGGTVTYAFSANLPPQQQAAYTSALSLWSDIADIQFKNVSEIGTANIRFDVAGDTSGGITFIPNNGSRPTGEGVREIPAQNSPNAAGGQANISINARNESFNNYDLSSSWTMSTVAHETGHVLGLGHAGNYNGVEFITQHGPYDQVPWTLMSYVGADDRTRPFASQYPVTTDWKGGVAQTPMALDILAIQRIYGESTSRTFAGGQTYGFNSNITGASAGYFDFTKNSVPFVTLYNRGTGNTLDVSGFNTNCTINLNPGTFSTASADSRMLNNICISYGTRIDTVVTGAGNDVIFGNAGSNVVNGGAGTNTFVVAGAASNFTVVKANATTIVTDKTTGAVDTLTNIQSVEFANPVCFTTGTRIDVVRLGTVMALPVEDLRVGDRALTATGEHRSIVWIGTRRIVPEAHPAPASQWPVRILAGAFGTDACGRPLPRRDLRLSPGHPVLVGAEADHTGGVLVPVMCLINGTTIRREPVPAVTYWHVELDAHDLLLAEGLPAESYFACGNRAWFDPGAEAGTRDDALVDPDGVAGAPPGRCRPVALAGPPVEAERRRIDAGFAQSLSLQAGWPGHGPLAADWI